MHRRHVFGPLGDVTNYKVRMSNLIAQNVATFLRLMFDSGKVFFVVLEQPKSSWLWHIPFIVSVGLILQCSQILTWFLALEYITVYNRIRCVLFMFVPIFIYFLNSGLQAW